MPFQGTPIVKIVMFSCEQAGMTHREPGWHSLGRQHRPAYVRHLHELYRLLNLRFESFSEQEAGDYRGSAQHPDS